MKNYWKEITAVYLQKIFFQAHKLQIFEKNGWV